MAVNWHGDAVASRIEKAVLDRAEEWCWLVKASSMEKTPVDHGTLRASHVVQRGQNEVVVGVGGPAAPYAQAVHDDTTAHHRVGEDHFVEKALKENMGQLESMIVAGIKAIL